MPSVHPVVRRTTTAVCLVVLLGLWSEAFAQDAGSLDMGAGDLGMDLGEADMGTGDAGALQGDTSVSEADPVVSEEEVARVSAQIFDSIASPFCPGRTLRSCPSANAQAMRDAIRADLATGATAEEAQQRALETFGGVKLTVSEPVEGDAPVEAPVETPTTSEAVEATKPASEDVEADTDGDDGDEEAWDEEAWAEQDWDESEWQEDGEWTTDDSHRVDTYLMTAEDMARVGGAATRMDEEDLEALEYDDPNSVLQQVPAVYVRREDGFGLRPNIGIRGANSERSKKITLMEDDILFAPAPYSAPAAYYFPIASRMTGLEVFKGPSAVRYGPHTVGGAVNWITRSIPVEESAGLDMNFGSYLTGKLHGYYGKNWEQFGFLVEGVQWQSNGYKELDGGGNTGFNKSEIMLKTRVNSDPASAVYHAAWLKLGFSRERSNETYLGLTDEDFAESPNRRYVASSLDQMNWWRTQGQLRYRLEVGSDFDIVAVGYRHDFSRSWLKLNDFADPTVRLSDVIANPTGSRRVYYEVLTGEGDSSNAEEELLIGTNDRTFVSQGVDVTASFRAGGDVVRNELQFGARVHNDSIERLHTEAPYAVVDGVLADPGLQRVTTHNFGRTMAYSAFVLDELTWRRLTVVPGARVELIDGSLEEEATGETVSNLQTAILPGLGAFYGLTKHFGVLAGAHRGFSPVSPGQPGEVEPETSNNYEAGARFSSPSTATLIEAVGYFNDYGNLLGECSFSAGCVESDVDDQFNAGRVWIYGVETVLTHRFDVSESLQFPARLSYTLSQSQFRSGFESQNPQFGDVEAGDELPYVPDHQASLRLGVKWNDLAVHTVGTYVSPMREEAGQGDGDLRTDPQYLVDLLASYTLFEGFSVYGKLDNVLNQRPIVSRRPYGARPTRPFMAQLGLRWKLP